MEHRAIDVRVTSHRFAMILLAAFLCCCASSHAYNMSPKPNMVIRDPQLVTYLPKVESSYFGFTLNLRPSGIIVGAPRAQSTLESQRKINETGAIYKCSLTSKTCSPFVFDPNGNINSENNEYTYDSEKKDNQWLGAAMDGGPKDTDKLVVCAPRLTAKAPNDYLLHGVCYWTPNTLGDKPMDVKRISPLKLKINQIKEKNLQRFYYYMLGEHGLSAHVTANGEEIIMGAPGIHTWKGSVVRYYEKTYTVDPSLSRRDTEGGRVSRQIEGDDEPRKEYVSEVPNPDKWGQPNDSYFGYAVGSGYFDSTMPEKLMYVATAPQASEQSGEAYVFDMTADTINSHYVFRGTQFGEYFGYSILAEDLNGDGLSDVIVSAPQHSISGSYDDGAIYVFINQGRFNFERKLLISPVHGKARFGTTLTKLGDINHDGYNDVAVGAPFAGGNGSVYIYLGSEKGLRDHHSQLLHSPEGLVPSPYGSHMFGHGLSKGSDIDSNGFNDFAVGAPNAEVIYVYRAYPVVQIIATVNSLSREIKPDQNKFQIRVCYMITTKSQKVERQDLAVRIVVDPQVKRVRLLRTQSNELSFNATAGTQNQCSLLDCEVRFSTADIFKPIELEMHYDIINGVPNSHEFCETCVAVDPAEPKVYSEKIIFSTGCASDICVADLQVKSSGLDNTYILGSGRSLSVTYVVTNNGETAYLPQINVTSSNRMPFARIPPSCKSTNDVLLICDLNRGQPIGKGGRDTLTVVYDVSGISGHSMVLTAEVFSTGREKTPSDNIAKNVITLKEFTEIEAIGSPKTPHINLEKVSGIVEVINNYEIRSMGPSTVGEIEIAFDIPVAYRVPGSTVVIPIIDMNNITVQAVYDAQLIAVDFYQNNTQLIMNPVELSTKTITKTTKMVFDSMNGLDYHSVKETHVNVTTHVEEISLGDSVLSSSMTRTRSRRQAVEQTASKAQYARIAQTKAHDLLSEEHKGTLPVNRTIVFNCNDSEMTVCVRAVMKIYNFKPEKPLAVTMKFHVDLKEVNQILIEPWEFFVILNSLGISKAGDTDGKSLHLTKKIEYNVISKHQLYGTPIWVIVLAVLGGLLALALITYGMYRAGFFKRTTKEEMDKLVHQNQAAGEEETETDNLNAGEH